MKTTIIAAVCFASGALAGALGGYFFAKKKVQSIADEEIQMAQNRMMDILRKYEETPTEDDVQDDIPEPEKTAPRQVNYTDYYRKSDATASINEAKYEAMVNEKYPDRFEFTDNSVNPYGEDIKDRPYLIDNRDFGEFDEYTKLDLIYYAQQILADEDGEIIEDPDHVVGLDNLAQCMLAGDTYYIRNDRMKCDYEVFVDPREYHEALLEENTPKEETE